jgi:hypothetical protein
VVQHRFEEFVIDLVNSEPRLDALLQLSQDLVGRHHGDKDAIEKRANEVAAHWDAVRRLTEARRLVRYFFLQIAHS